MINALAHNSAAHNLIFERTLLLFDQSIGQIGTNPSF